MTIYIKESIKDGIYDVDLFDMLQNDVFHFESLGSFLLAGDVNARVGLKPDYIVWDALVQNLILVIITETHPQSGPLRI